MWPQQLTGSLSRMIFIGVTNTALTQYNENEILSIHVQTNRTVLTSHREAMCAGRHPVTGELLELLYGAPGDAGVLDYAAVVDHGKTHWSVLVGRIQSCAAARWYCRDVDDVRWIWPLLRSLGGYRSMCVEVDVTQNFFKIERVLCEICDIDGKHIIIKKRGKKIYIISWDQFIFVAEVISEDEIIWMNEVE